MNLLKIEIEKIISEEKINDKEIMVKVIFNCWGARKTEVRKYSITHWEELKKRGYYYG